MEKNKSLTFLFIFYLLIPIYLTDLTGLHYLFTTNCSSSTDCSSSANDSSSADCSSSTNDSSSTNCSSSANCSSSTTYIPQGPYFFSQHWPFTSITVQYHREINDGTCSQDGSLRFVLNNNIYCFGMYKDGEAKLFCAAENNQYCLIDMKTSDGSRLTCDGRI